MKKKLFLLPLMMLALTACDGFNPNDFLGGGSGEKSVNSGEATSYEKISPNDVAIKIADTFSIFPEVGDEVDLDDYIDFDTGTNYKLSDFTFTSLNPDVISINNYHAICVGQGYAGVKISGPGLNIPPELSFFVGSIAGSYVPDSKTLNGVIDLDIIQDAEGAYSFALKVTENGKQYNKRDIVAYDGGGSLIKNISPFLPMDFEGAAPSSFDPITSFITELVPETEGVIEDITDDVYAMMTADPDEGLLIKMRFNEKFITLIAE